VSEDPKPLVLCLVGTDHHPFPRLISWCDSLATKRPDIEVFVQHGRSLAPMVARAEGFLDKPMLSESLSRAHVAITHGGPGLISDIRAAGLAPLVVARNPDLGEHVDGHQMRFVSRIASIGIVRSLSTESELIDEVERQLSVARGGLVDPAADARRVATSVDRFSELVEPLLREHR
jgi:UDP-N-acetylglucosamine transferase subunit ALG13